MTGRPPLSRFAALVPALVLMACYGGDDPAGPDSDDAAQITILADGVSLEVFGSDTVDAEVRTDDGRLIEDAAITWFALDDSVATIDQAGVMTGRSLGGARMVARLGPAADTAVIEVAVPAAAVLSLSEESVLIGERGELQLEAALAMPDGRKVPGAAFDWSTSDEAVVEVSAEGVVTAGQMGSASIGARVAGREATAEVEVTYGWQEVLPSRFHTCALRVDGQAYCWGMDRSGQVGNGSPNNFEEAPVPVSGAHRFVTLTLGEHHTCGIDEEDAAWCWGWNQNGAVGSEEIDPTCGRAPCLSTPVRVQADRGFLAMSGGEDRTCGIADDGFAWCWGRNGRGEVGTETNFGTGDPVFTPHGVTLSRTLRDLTAGSFAQTHALTLDGQVFVWGLHEWTLPEDQIEDSRCTQQECFIARPVPDAPILEDLVAGFRWTCGRTSPGEVYCWGNMRSALPTPLDLGEPVAELGRAHVALWLCAITEDRRGLCWGTDQDPGALFELRGDLELQAVASGSGIGPPPGICAVTTTNLGYCWTWESGQDPAEAEPQLLPAPVERP